MDSKPNVFSRPIFYWERYLYFLDKRPVVTKSITAAVLSVVAEILAQSLVSNHKNNTIGFNYIGIWHQFVIGLLLRGPWVHYWLQFLEYLFIKFGFSPKQQQQLLPVIIKVIIDQTTFTV